MVGPKREGEELKLPARQRGLGMGFALGQPHETGYLGFPRRGIEWPEKIFSNVDSMLFLPLNPQNSGYYADAGSMRGVLELLQRPHMPLFLVYRN
jgi:hypothetical protein